MIRGMRGLTQRRAHGETRANEYYTESGVRQGSFCGGTGLAGGRAHLNGTLPPPCTTRVQGGARYRAWWVKKCPRGVKASKESILIAEAGRPTPYDPLRVYGWRL